MWDLIVSVPDNCLSVYFSTKRSHITVPLMQICFVLF